VSCGIATFLAESRVYCETGGKLLKFDVSNRKVVTCAHKDFWMPITGVLFEQHTL